MQQLLLSLSPCRVGHRVCSSIHVRLQHASPVHRSTRLRCTAADAGDSSEEQRITSRTKGVSAEDRVISNADALLLSLEELSNNEGREARANNIVFGADESLDRWRQLDEQVNEYPGPRIFKAIGEASEDFEQSMIAAVENVVGTISGDRVTQRHSKNGKFVTVTIGPVYVEDAEQVIAVYTNMQQDKRLKFRL